MSAGWLTLPEAARAAGVSRNTLWNWLVDGVIPAAAVLQTGRRSYRVAAWWARGERPDRQDPTAVSLTDETIDRIASQVLRRIAEGVTP